MRDKQKGDAVGSTLGVLTAISIILFFGAALHRKGSETEFNFYYQGQDLIKECEATIPRDKHCTIVMEAVVVVVAEGEVK